ncbi:hypothetical protein BJF86_14955 [Serinicoccus sp. CNJ-927]|nr:hypothetical protein BJF82_13285 [Kytococcus sp. CUA-901]OLT42489.1 hypothetical protein BJF86_14955 [Serinicoccus sp. CNJ-927]
MFALKKTARSWYDTIISKVAQGRTIFVKWWDTKVPTWIKKTFTFGGTAISGGAVYDAVKWLFGL